MVDGSERIIVHAGASAMMLMTLLDDEIGFGTSSDWVGPVGESASSSITCAYGGGIDATAQRTDYRRVEGTLKINDCATSLGTTNGTVSFSYDDAVWLEQSNPKSRFALELNPRNVVIASNDGRIYRVASGTAYCDSGINDPLVTLEYDPVFRLVTRYFYGRDPSTPLLSQYGDYRGYSYDVTDESGQLKQNVVSPAWNCDLVNLPVSVENQTHVIEDLKFSSGAVWGDSTQINYHVSTGRTSRLSQIGSGLVEAGGSKHFGRFEHSDFGFIPVESGRNSYFGDYAVSLINDPDYPAGVKFKYALYNNNRSGPNWWSFTESRLSGGEVEATLPDLDENGSSDSYEVIPNSGYLVRGICAAEVLVDWFGFDFFENGRFEVPDLLVNLRSSKVCAAKNYWFVDVAYDGSFLESYQRDFDGDQVHDYYDDDDDNDGVVDALDVFPKDSTETKDFDRDGIGDNADQDDDNDGTSDELDAFPFNPNEILDTDSDGIGNNADTDDDGDGYVDSMDAFPLDSTEHLDTDADGIGNNRDRDDDNDGASDELERESGSNPLIQDTDDDSMLDGFEISNGYDPNIADCPRFLCPKISPVIMAISNSAYDFDKDGLSRAQEELIGTSWQLADTDGDGLSDSEEIGLSTNPRLADTDDDGITDGQELRISTDPSVPDSDNDGLNDSEEIALSTNPLLADSDGDMMIDGEEVEEGLNPNDGNDCPKWYCGGGITTIIPAMVP